MSDKTRCPDCATVFFVSPDQLAARDGFVRCGRCGALFDARLHFLQGDNAGSAGAELSAPLLVAEGTGGAGVESRVSAPAQDIPAAAAVEETAPYPTPQDDAAVATAEPSAPAVVPVFLDTRRLAPWAWRSAAGVLAVVLLVQGLWWFRGDIAARFPATRGSFAAFCDAVGCDVPLLADPDRLRLTSSELESDPARPSLITLHAVIVNQAGHSLAFPHLELILTDSSERVIARKVFKPEDYLAEQVDATAGIPGNGEVEAKMRLALDGFAASGYQLELFFP